jgi:hypothetical protein
MNQSATGREQSELWPFCLILLNVSALYLGSLPLILWMAPPNPIMYLVAPIALALFVGNGIGVVVAIAVLCAVFMFSIWSGRTWYWWAIPAGLFVFSFGHAVLAINALRAYIT